MSQVHCKFWKCTTCLEIVVYMFNSQIGWDELAGSKLGFFLSTQFGPMFLKDHTILVFYQPLCSSAVQCEDVSWGCKQQQRSCQIQSVVDSKLPTLHYLSHMLYGRFCINFCAIFYCLANSVHHWRKSILSFRRILHKLSENFFDSVLQSDIKQICFGKFCALWHCQINKNMKRIFFYKEKKIGSIFLLFVP